ncbi:MAG TPA: caspase family protein [Acidimicrobiales bacterium]|nr:caspase family protein [Acidimicrobiales bacterium]
MVTVNRYKPPTKMAGGPKDAETLRQAFLEHGFPPDHIKVLTEQAATAANIRTEMDRMASQAGANSLSALYFAGHVKQKRGDVDRDGEDVDEFLWTWDNQFISDAELGHRMRAVPGRVWVAISGCEAAGFDDGIASPRHLFTASSKETENSYTIADGHSVFGGLMVRDALLGGHGDADGNGAVSLQEAFNHALELAPRQTVDSSNGPQTPQIAGGDGNEWFLQPPAPAQAATAGTCVAGVCLPPPVPALPLPPLPLPPLPIPGAPPLLTY